MRKMQGLHLRVSSTEDEVKDNVQRIMNKL